MIELENIRWMIKNSGMSMMDIEEATGVHRNTVRRIANEKGYNPTYKTIRILLNYFREG